MSRTAPSRSASARYDVDLAPTGLALVHDFLNTRAAGRPRQADLLADLGTARAWFDGAVDLWAERTGAPRPEVEPFAAGDLPRLLRMREQLTVLLRARDGEESDAAEGRALTGRVRLTLGPDGVLVAEPRGDGREWLTGALLAEVQRAQQTDTWRRLKVCRSHLCSGAFYDRSRNNSGVWHDVRVCGNAVNLRASRARRRAADPAT